MNLSFREKSLWIDLGATLAIAAYYATSLIGFSTEGLADINAVMDLLWDIVVFSIVVSIVSGIVLSAHDKKSAKAPLDEREKLSELKASRYGYWILQVGITVPVLIYALDVGGRFPTSFDIPPFASLHLMVCLFVAAEIIVTANQLWQLRRGL